MEDLLAKLDIAPVTRTATVFLVGGLDATTSRVLALKVAVALVAEPARMRIDVSSVTTCDSHGLRTLTGVYDLCKEDGVAFEVTGASESMAKLFVTAGLSNALDRTTTPSPGRSTSVSSSSRPTTPKTATVES